MILIIIFTSLVILVALFNIFVYILGMKISYLERKIIKQFQRRTSQMVGIYQTTKKDLVKAPEIFNDFFELKRREISEDGFDMSLENKILTYKKIHNELNFIFKTCEKHRSIQLNPIYIFLRDGIIDRSQEIGENMKKYNAIKEKYDKYKNITRMMIIGYLY